MDLDTHGHRFVYTIFAAVAGAVTALSMLEWKRMTWQEITLTVFVGATFSLFAVPWLAADVAGVKIDNLRVICGVTYMGATGANILIPVAIRRLRGLLGLEEAK